MICSHYRHDKKWQYLCRCLLVLVFIGGVIPAKAQLVERVCRTDYKISPERKGELLLELDNISFSKAMNLPVQ